MLAVFDGTIADRSRGRLHVGTAAVDASIGRAGRDALELPDGRPAGIARLAEPIALRAGDRFVVRRGHAVGPVGGTVLDARPPRGVSRRRQTAARVAALEGGGGEARLELHGVVAKAIAADLTSAAEAAALDAVRAGQRSAAAIRTAVAAVLRRGSTVRRDTALQLAADVLDRVVASGRLVRSGDAIALPGELDAGPDAALLDAMARLLPLLSVPAPPSLADAARSVGCPPEGIRLLERDGRIVVLEPDLAYAAATYRDLAAQAVELASREPLTPARLRDATGTSRRYVMAILEDLDRRAVLRRTPAGHVLGPKAPTAIVR
jgi:selenocysteine-specific elongation factor